MLYTHKNDVLKWSYYVLIVDVYIRLPFQMSPHSQKYISEIYNFRGEKYILPNRKSNIFLRIYFALPKKTYFNYKTFRRKYFI